MINEAQKNKILENWGEDIYLKILRDIETYSKKWKLYDFGFVENYSMNAIFFCKSELYGDCVLKIGGNCQDAEFVSEYNVLREYNGRRFVKVLESAIEIETRKKIMLIERIIPGITLQSELRQENRLFVFSNLYDGLHIEPKNPLIYQKYVDKMDYYADIVGKQKDCEDLYVHALKAKDIYASVAVKYNKEMLLHGDLHFNNILLSANGVYTIIDPQGLIGDPVFDVPRYIMIEYYHYINTIEDYRVNKSNSWENRINKVNAMIEYITNSLSIPEHIIRKCFYVEMIVMECWDASNGSYDIDNVIFANAILNKK